MLILIKNEYIGKQKKNPTKSVLILKVFTLLTIGFAVLITIHFSPKKIEYKTDPVIPKNAPKTAIIAPTF